MTFGTPIESSVSAHLSITRCHVPDTNRLLTTFAATTYSLALCDTYPLSGAICHFAALSGWYSDSATVEK